MIIEQVPVPVHCFKRLADFAVQYMTDDANDGNLSQIKRNEELYAIVSSVMHTAPTIFTVSVRDVSVLLLTITCG